MKNKLKKLKKYKKKIIPLLIGLGCIFPTNIYAYEVLLGRAFIGETSISQNAYDLLTKYFGKDFKTVVILGKCDWLVDYCPGKIDMEKTKIPNGLLNVSRRIGSHGTAEGHGEKSSFSYDYTINRDVAKSLGFTDDMIDNPNAYPDQIYNLNPNNLYSDTTIDSKFSSKVNVGGDNITNPEIWRTNLELEDGNNTQSKLDEKVNKDASNLSASDIAAWKNKLDSITEEELRNLVDNKYGTDGSDLPDNVKENLMKLLDLQKKSDTNKLFETKVNKDYRI